MYPPSSQVWSSILPLKPSVHLVQALRVNLSSAGTGKRQRTSNRLSALRFSQPPTPSHWRLLVLPLPRPFGGSAPAISLLLTCVTTFPLFQPSHFCQGNNFISTHPSVSKTLVTSPDHSAVYSIPLLKAFLPPFLSFSPICFVHILSNLISFPFLILSSAFTINFRIL